MWSCGFTNLVSTPCDPSKYQKHSKESVIIRNCCKDIKGHLRSLNTFDSGMKSEGKVILARAGKSYPMNIYPIVVDIHRDAKPCSSARGSGDMPRSLFAW